MSADPLATYRRKRRFDRTPEPAPGRKAAAGARFVVQKHDARRLHYDFRLELDGTMKSWAVTRGPSLDPADRRLAVHVEDHPIAYNDFEGTIPRGQYGGGTVMLWDRGKWEPVGDARRGYAEGKLKFQLHGEHLKGGWMLVRMRGKDWAKGHDNWLLIKERDRFAKPGNGDRLLARVTHSIASGRTMKQLADEGGPRKKTDRPEPQRPARKARRKSGNETENSELAAVAGARRGPLLDFVPPELATLVDRPPKAEGWLHEIKIDGYRAYCRRGGNEVRFLTRTGKDWTPRFRHLVQPVRSLAATRLALDGEITVLDGDGASSFAALQEALSTDDQRSLSFIVFDLLHLDGYDLREAALVDRKRLLAELLERSPGKGPIRYSDHVEATGTTVFQHACEMALEGVVSKQADQPYRSGRGGAWLKSKCVARQEFVIIGFTHPKAGARGIGALLLGYHDDGEMIYAGRVGSGFSNRISLQLRAQLEKLATEKAAAEVPAAARRGALWVRPELTCEVEFLSWTPDGMLRHPSFQGLREDKKPAEIVREKANVAPSRPSPKRKRRRAATAPATAGRATVAGIAITHPDRVVFPKPGATKLELARYYETVAGWILPHVGERPVNLLRCPQGIAQQCFFQKHFKPTELKSLRRVVVEEQEGRHEYVMVRTVSDLVSLVQNGIIEFHPWGARGDDPDQPDRLIFDLDPSSPSQWKRVVETALAIRERLRELDLESFVKTTGGKGIHVVVPLRRGASWDEAKAFTRALAESFVKAVPSMFTINPLKQRRAGKIFIDYLRNDRGQTAVAPYSVRARDGATVAMPLGWDEVTPELRPEAFTLRTVPDLLRKRRDPWRDMAKTRQTITAAARRALDL